EEFQGAGHMSELRTAPIKAFALGIFDGPHATPKEVNEGTIFLGIKNVTPDGRLDFSEIRHVSEQEFPKWTKRVTPQKDDVVFSYEATLHRYALIPEGFLGCLGRRMALVRPDLGKIVPRFLHYYFMSPAWRAVVEANTISGATVDRIPIKKFPDFDVSIPSISKQRSISDTLSAYDDLIENNRRRIHLLEQAARLLYKEWFVHLRFPGHEHVKIVDGVPEGWEKKKLGDVAPLKYGKALKSDDRVPGPFPVYGSSGVVGTHTKPLVLGPTIIVGRKGNVGSVYWSPDDCHPIDTVYFIDSERCSLFLYYALKQMNFINTDVAVPGLNRDFAHSRSILIADQKILRLFDETVTPLHQQMELLKRQNASLAGARDLLLPKLMNGEVAV
ncbi:MAG: restriction endonuclease subunit S, partial [Planctomycetales bacterium]|nr:restriction endonuclease subunit S [Planctomycetales bacterium]